MLLNKCHCVGRRSGIVRSRPAGEVLEGRTLLSGAGTLDPTFGNGGVAVTASVTQPALAIAVEPDGKVVAVAGTLNRGGLLLRFNRNGSLDTGFGNRGEVALAPPEEFAGLLIQPDGKIVEAGNTYIQGPSAGLGSLIYASSRLTRYNPDGSIDPTFGNNGTVVEDRLPIAKAALDGTTILFAGSPVEGSFLGDLPTPYYDVGSLNADGSVTTGFGRNGVATARFPGGGDVSVSSMAVAPGGTIVVSGYHGVSGALLTFSPTGQVVKMATPVLGGALAVAPDGKIVEVYGGFSQGNANPVALARYNLDLTPDMTFGHGGRALTPSVPGAGRELAAVVEPDGKVIVLFNGKGATSSLVGRFNTNGSLDTSFGNGGTVALPVGYSSTPVLVGPAAQSVPQIAFDPAGNTVVIAGLNRGGFALAKLSTAATTPAAGSYVFQGLSVRAPSGRSFTHPVADLVIPASTSSDFSGDRFLINWGDGRSSFGKLAPFHGAYAVVGTHRYARRGVFHTTVTITGPGGPLNVTRGAIAAG